MEDLRDGWYGNLHKNEDGAMEIRVPEDEEDADLVEEIKPADCDGLVCHSIKCANERVAAVIGIYEYE